MTSSTQSRQLRLSPTPRIMSEQPALRASWLSASTQTSQLSTSYMLTRTTEPPCNSPDIAADVESCQIQENNGDNKSYAYEYSQTRPQEKMERFTDKEDVDEDGDTSLPTLTFFPPSPSESTQSVNTYDSRYSESALNFDTIDSHKRRDASNQPESICLPAAEDASIPSSLGPYRTMPADPYVRPSGPGDFSHLFPSTSRLFIRHDDTTSDGNMNLRVDTMVGPGGAFGSRRRRTAVQLFHLRLHDLASRDFSFRRYGRDSGREVCFSKRGYAETPTHSRGSVQNSVSSALQSVKIHFRRSNASHSSSLSVRTASTSRRSSIAGSSTARSISSNGRTSLLGMTSGHSTVSPQTKFLFPTDTINLEFSNYAHVEVSRLNPNRYGFSWWGHKYIWKRTMDKTLHTVSFHLVRDGKSEAIAHIVPEIRSPTEIEVEKQAGGWIPPCCMWINDPSVMEAMTDVADVIVATGLMTLVDDCIRMRWQSKKHITGPAPPGAWGTHHGADPTPDDSDQSPVNRRFFRRRRHYPRKPFHFGGKTVSVC